MKLKFLFALWISGLFIMASSCNEKPAFRMEVFESSADGKKMELVKRSAYSEKALKLTVDTSKRYQLITGFGGSFTESSAYLLNQLSKENRDKIVQAYFGDSGARYSLTRTHINSCDFSLSNYAYVKNEGNKVLSDFSLEEDKDDIIPFIKEAMAVSSDGFKIIASPWTAPPWMKDNNSWVGGKLLPEYYDAWSLYFSKYIDACKEEGIDIWGITVENEPLGNGNNWESMHYSAEEMTEFVAKHLGPSLEANNHGDVVLLGYDQNRDELEEWVDAMYKDEESGRYFDGTAIHWYASTYEVFSEVLQYAHKKAPDKYLIETEGCVDAEVPHWQDDAWYWKKEATDWGWDWASEETKYRHPKYAPVYRYARDIIGCLNNWVDGWVDWNMLLDRQGGPNWFKNWCVAPVIVDPDQDEVYFTPLYYTLMHFSKYIRPGAHRIDWNMDSEKVLITAVQNSDNSVVIVLLNPNEEEYTIKLELHGKTSTFVISSKALQTVVINKN